MTPLIPFKARKNDYFLIERLKKVYFPVLLIPLTLVLLGILILYSVGKGWSPWAIKQLTRFGVGFLIGAVVICFRTRFFMDIAYPFYAVILILLICVGIFGRVGMGGQRWIDLYILQIQPSELMRIALLVVLSRYFCDCTDQDIKKIRTWILPITLTILPIILVLKQPDLGTAMMLLMSAVTIFLVAGFSLWVFGLVAAGSCALIPFFYGHLHEYQKKRILIFLDPDMDPLGSGYNLLQSKIALGSGRFFGKGLFKGTQSHLDFLPEKQTDFILATLGEELGFIGIFFVFFLFFILVGYGYYVTFWAKRRFSKLLAIGLTNTIFLYLFINAAMVSGIVPIVGVPCPFLSYGGTSMITLFITMGLLLGIDIENRHRSY